jgi:voltage-gated potassium channel
MAPIEKKKPEGSRRGRLHEIIFEADTPSGKAFDVALIVAIILSVIAVMLDSVVSIQENYGAALIAVEWFFTILFSIEYGLRLSCIGRPAKYATSFFGIVDLLAILPTYLSLLVPGSQYLIVIRILRVLRVFRVFKLAQYIAESNQLIRALRASTHKIIVFLFVVFTLVVVFGSLMYLIEGRDSGFTSIPRGIYWAVVTLTTVGYGDISPKSAIGQTVAALVMIMGFAIIAVPTGIVTAELSRVQESTVSTQACPQCSAEGHTYGARYCKDCGALL